MNTENKFKKIITIFGGIGNIKQVYPSGTLTVYCDNKIKKEYYGLIGGVHENQDKWGFEKHYNLCFNIEGMQEFIWETVKTKEYLEYLENKFKKEIEAEDAYFKDF